MTHILIPRDPSTALLRPFIGCQPQELPEAYAAMARIAEVQHARAGNQGLQQIAEPAALADVSKEQYARMFGAACEALGQISDCLGINSDINPGAEPIIAAIEELRAGKTHPVLDDRWKARILDGRALAAATGISRCRARNPRPSTRRGPQPENPSRIPSQLRCHDLRQPSP